VSPAGWNDEGGQSKRHLKTEMAKTNPLQFLQQVRSEASKVTWPTRRETIITTVMVFIMVALAMVFFFLADTALSYIVSLVLGFGGN
jgi:preprotein translocase subunit SecE